MQDFRVVGLEIRMKARKKAEETKKKKNFFVICFFFFPLYFPERSFSATRSLQRLKFKILIDQVELFLFTKNFLKHPSFVKHPFFVGLDI